MNRDEAIAEEARINEVRIALASLEGAATDLRGNYAVELDYQARKVADEFANHLPGPEKFPVQLDDKFGDPERDDHLQELYYCTIADDRKIVLRFPRGENTIEYRTGALEISKARGWISREDMERYGLIYVEG